MSESISFDRAAAFYDATRRLPEELANAITRALLAEIRAAGAKRVLEVGIGTGRMARPLMLEGVRIVGVDISTEMIGQLRAQLAPEHETPELLLADATALPFRDHVFRAAMVVHVLHLVASAEDALQEIRRVLAPGGVLLQQLRRPDAATLEKWESHDRFWDDRCRERGFMRRKRPESAEIKRMLLDLGGIISETELMTEEDESSVERELENLRSRKHSWMWEIPDAILDESMTAFEAWLRDHTDRTGRFVDRVTYFIETCRW